MHMDVMVLKGDSSEPDRPAVFSQWLVSHDETIAI